MKTLLQSEKFKINVVVDKASTTQAVRAALQAAGLNTNFTASDLRAAKAAAIQTKAEASAAAARELARQRAARAAKAELDLANARERSAQCSKAAHDSHSQYEWSNEQPVEYCRTIKK